MEQHREDVPCNFWGQETRDDQSEHHSADQELPILSTDPTGGRFDVVKLRLEGEHLRLRERVLLLHEFLELAELLRDLGPLVGRELRVFDVFVTSAREDFARAFNLSP